MKEKLHIRKAATLASLVGLIFLLLLSPCKVRNSVQTALEIPQTEVSNKSVCQVYEDIESVSAVTKTVHQISPAFIDPKPQLTAIGLELSLQQTSMFTGNANSVTRIPYYILYQNLKVHL